MSEQALGSHFDAIYANPTRADLGASLRRTFRREFWYSFAFCGHPALVADLRACLGAHFDGIYSVLALLADLGGSWKAVFRRYLR